MCNRTLINSKHNISVLMSKKVGRNLLDGLYSSCKAKHLIENPLIWSKLLPGKAELQEILAMKRDVFWNLILVHQQDQLLIAIWRNRKCLGCRWYCTYQAEIPNDEKLISEAGYVQTPSTPPPEYLLTPTEGKEIGNLYSKIERIFLSVSSWYCIHLYQKKRNRVYKRRALIQYWVKQKNKHLNYNLI